MAEKYDILPVKLNGKNYFSWEFQFRMFVKGKNLWGHLDGSVSKPKNESDIGKITQWNSNNAQVISWILGSVESQIVLSLRSFHFAKDMWDFLKKIYHQENSARRFQLELELSEYCQGNLSIQDYYSGFLNLWAEYKELVYAFVPPEGLPILQQVHEVSQRDQFLMKLRREYEPIRVNLMSRIPSPSLETCFAELFREEQRCVTQSVLENKNHQRANPMEIAYATQAKVRDMSKVQCYSCKEYGHIANHCKKKFCNYCKNSGHLIVECRRRPQNRTSQALHVSHSSSAPGFDSGSISRPDSSSGMTNLTPEVVQQLIYSALSTLGISGTSTHSHVCYIDSGASNHMVSFPKSLVNVKPSLGNLEIQTANGDKLPVKVIGDIPHSLPLNNVFLVPHLTSNLLSVGQLVDENCKVSFSPSGCIVQDQTTGKVIGMGPKCGRLFPLRLSVYPNNKSLFSLFSPVSLSQSSITSLDLSFACDGCKLGKIPSHFWVEALSTSVHLINRLPSPVLDNETPNFRLYGNNPDYNHLRVFGCLCYAHLPSSDRNKLIAQSARCAFLGYASDQKGYLCYDPLASRTRISRNVLFVENIYFFQHVSDSSTSSSSYLPNFDQLENVRFNTGIDDQHRENSQDAEGSSRNPIPASDPPIEQGEFLNLGPDRSIGQSDVSNMPDAPPLRRSTRHIKPPDRLSLMAALSVTNVPKAIFKRMARQIFEAKLLFYFFLLFLSPVTSKVDVYSYGIVALEVVTRKKPTGNQLSESGRMVENHRRLVTWVKEKMVEGKRPSEEGWIKEIADPVMGGKFDMAKLEIVVKVALQCVEEDREARPTMRQVVEMLECHREEHIL
ncbi:hypothetical protein FEM48_Zijuj02G0009500 [Ziziphus jujuba var. spinosa]|uniref:CCHC-type domain-containing protein n=1 Tax=Ziziphus jujuba var. spinosa TaxID=714518 RepID=A0A978VSN8_ZIZJJ|nr:hypothetical protein FEM48_Zijuj02G0009500 [Ziziphus jujuba var. spinosa]